jgi:hypothetical protein
MIIAVILSLAGWCSGGMTEEYSKWYEQGIDYVRQGDLEGAKLSFSMALSYKPGDANAQRGLDMSEERLKQKVALAPAPVQVVPKSESKDRSSMRVTVGNAPGADEFERSGATGPLDEGGGFRAEVVYVKRYLEKGNPDIGGSFGGGLFVAQHSGTDVMGDTFDATAYGGLIQGGFVAKAGNHVVWEVGLYLGLGLADVDISDVTSSGTTVADSGTYAMGGLKAGVFYLWGEQVEVGLELGYESFATTVELTNGFMIDEITVKGAGPRVAAVVAYKF